MGEKTLLRAVQLATQHLRIDSQSGRQFLLKSPALAESGSDFLTKEIEIG